MDERLKTTADGVWAAGDVTGGLRFTHVADYQARLAMRVTTDRSLNFVLLLTLK